MVKPSGLVKLLSMPHSVIASIVASIIVLSGCGGSGEPVPRLPIVFDALVLYDVTFPDDPAIRIVDKRTIGDISALIERSVYDPNMYFCAKTTRLECEGAMAILPSTMKLCGALFDLGSVQYKEQTGKLWNILSGMLGCGEALVTTASMPTQTLVFGSPLIVECTVRNAGDHRVRIPTAAVMHVDWMRRNPLYPGMWEGSSTMVFDFDAGDAMSSDPTYVETSSEYTYMLSVPTDAMETGELRLVISFSQAIGEGLGAPDVVLPPGFTVVVTLE